MKDSIQKIIDKLKDSTWYNPKDTTGTEWIELTWEETHLLLDYITNLQDNRINKAIEYIKEHKNNVYDTFGGDIIFGKMDGIKELLNILKGSDK